jgi:hypothetical protein
MRQPDGRGAKPDATAADRDAPAHEPSGVLDSRPAPGNEPGGVLDSRPAPRGLNRLVRTGWRRSPKPSRAASPDAPRARAAPAVDEPLRLRVEMVPQSSWYKDLRQLLDEATWERISSLVAERAGERCEICGGRGPRHRPVECHELWRFDDPVRVQTLVRVVALCPDCHAVKHWETVRKHGGDTQARAHLARVNGWSLAQTDTHIRDAFGLWAQRNQGPWIVDLEGLRPYLGAAEYARIARRATTPPTSRY